MSNVSEKLRQISHWQRYVSSPRSSAFYVGWLGYLNLGDEILWEAAQECVSPLQLTWVRQPRRGVLKWLANHKRHSLAILGGGTQIGEPSPIDWFKHGLSIAGTGVVFGAGVSPALEDAIPAWLKRWGDVLRPLPYVGVRGPESAATLARVGVRADVLGDPVCWFSQPIEFWVPKDKTVGLNVGHSNGHMYGDELDIQAKLAAYARCMSQRGWAVEFFCVWPDDLNTVRRVAVEAGILEPVVHCIYQDARQFLDRVRTLKMFVGIKLHGVALAMCANVPSLMLEYRPKCREFMATLGLDRFVLRSDEITLDVLLALTGELDDHGPEVAASIRASMTGIQRRLKEVGREIAALSAR